MIFHSYGNVYQRVNPIWLENQVWKPFESIPYLFRGKWSTCDKHQTRLDSEPGSVEWVCNHRPIWADSIQVTSVCIYIYIIIYISAFSWYNSTSSLRSWGIFFTAGLFSSPDPCWSLLIPVGCQATFSERVRLVPVHLCLWSSTIKPQVATKMGPKRAIGPSAQVIWGCYNTCYAGRKTIVLYIYI